MDVQHEKRIHHPLENRDESSRAKKRENTPLGAISSYTYASSVRPSESESTRSHARAHVARRRVSSVPPTARKHDASSYLAHIYIDIYIDRLNTWLYMRRILMLFHS